MTETLTHNGFAFSEIVTLKKEEVGSCQSDRFDLLISDAEKYSPPGLQSGTLKDKLHEISILNEVNLNDSIMTPISGIEATDVCSLYEQFLEYEQASDVEPLSYPESSIMSPDASPRAHNNDVVLGRLMCVQEKLSREVASDGESTPVNVVCNDTLVMNLPNDDKLLRTVNGIHPKGNLLRMADSPKFAKFKKKRLTNDPPLRIASSLPNTPRCTSPSDTVSSEERKNMEIKLIEALALPVPKQNVKSSKDSTKKAATPPCTGKRKQPPVEPIPSRLLPVVSKRQRNNLEKNKSIKDPRLKSTYANVDPRLNKADYGTKSNVIQFKNTNLVDINSSTNTATETVDDVCIIDMTIDEDPDNISETVIVSTTVVENGEITPLVTPLVLPLVTPAEIPLQAPSQLPSQLPSELPLHTPLQTPLQTHVETHTNKPSETPLHTPLEITSETPFEIEVVCLVEDDTFETIDESSELQIVEFPSLTAIEIKTEVCDMKNTDKPSTNGTVQLEKEIYSSGLIKPHKNYRKGVNKELNGAYSSGSEHESDDDDRAYNRKKMSKKASPSSKKCQNSKTSSKSENSRSRSQSKTPSANNSKSSSRHHSRSPSKPRSRRTRVKRSRSPSKPKVKSESESSSSSSDRSDSENMDISNKLSELSNPVPYDIEHERKLRFLSGGASKGMGERRNIYAGGITEDTSKAELGERFRRFGKISKITLHFREKGDNYAFIVFEDPDNAMRAIEEGNDDRGYPHLDLCFGGRRKFVGGSYVDFDGNNRYLEECDKNSINNRCESSEDDFDRLLQLAMHDSKKRETSPEWS